MVSIVGPRPACHSRAPSEAKERVSTWVARGLKKRRSAAALGRYRRLGAGVIGGQVGRLVDGLARVRHDEDRVCLRPHWVGLLDFFEEAAI